MRNAFVCVLILLSSLVLGQTSRTVFGLKAGLMQSTVNGADVDSVSPAGGPEKKNGFMIGIGLNSMLSKYFWLKHDVFYSQKGANLFLSDAKNAKYTSTLSLAYIDLYPLSLTLHYKGLQVFAGPHLGMLVSKQQSMKDSTGKYYTKEDVFVNGFDTKSFNKIDGGYVAGIEFEFNFGCNLGIRWQQSLLSLLENTTRLQGPINIYNRSLCVSVGYTFDRKYGLIKK